MRPITSADLGIEGHPLVQVELRLADGSLLERTWTIGEAAEIPEWIGRPGGSPAALPDWLLAPGRDWPHPRGPIELRGDVAAGHEGEARVAMGFS